MKPQSFTMFALPIVLAFHRHTVAIGGYSFGCCDRHGHRHSRQSQRSQKNRKEKVTEHNWRLTHFPRYATLYVIQDDDYFGTGIGMGVAI